MGIGELVAKPSEPNKIWANEKQINQLIRFYFLAQLWKQNSDTTLTNKSGRWAYHYKKWTILAECVVGTIQDEEGQAQYTY